MHKWVGSNSVRKWCSSSPVHVQLLHGMENTTNLMLAQFAAGLVHFADYKRCKVLGDLLGVDDPTRGPPLDHRAALFLYRLLSELRTVSTGNTFSTTKKRIIRHAALVH